MDTTELVLDEEYLTDLIFFTESEKFEIIEFITRECLFNQNYNHQIQINETKLCKIFSFLITGKITWNTKIIYSEYELNKILQMYARSSEFIQSRLDPLMEAFKLEIFGPIE